MGKEDHKEGKPQGVHDQDVARSTEGSVSLRTLENRAKSQSLGTRKSIYPPTLSSLVLRQVLMVLVSSSNSAYVALKPRNSDRGLFKELHTVVVKDIYFNYFCHGGIITYRNNLKKKKFIGFKI